MNTVIGVIVGLAVSFFVALLDSIGAGAPDLRPAELARP
jgi:hypothetical protein